MWSSRSWSSRSAALTSLALLLGVACTRRDSATDFPVGRTSQALSPIRGPEQEMSFPNMSFPAGVAIDGAHAAVTVDAYATHPYRYEGGSWVPDGVDIISAPSAHVPSSSYRGSSVDISGDALINANYYEDGDAASDGTLIPSFRFDDGSTALWHTPASPDDQIQPSVTLDTYGWSVSVDGNHAVATARQTVGLGIDDTKAYVLRRNGQAWVEETILASATFPEYIDSAVISGNSIALGGPNSARVYVLNGTTWSLEQQIDPPEMPSTEDSFGESVALSGDTLVVGRYRDADDGSNAGAAYVYTRSASVWTLLQKLHWSRAANVAWLGIAVAIDGDTIVLGATGAGSAVVYTRLPGGRFIERMTLAPATPADQSVYFGYSAALSGTQAIIGSHRGAHFYSLLMNPGDPCAGDGFCTSNRCVASRCTLPDGALVPDAAPQPEDASAAGTAEAGHLTEGGIDAAPQNAAGGSPAGDAAAGGSGGATSGAGGTPSSSGGVSSSSGGAVGAGGTARGNGGAAGAGGGAAGAAVSSGGRQGGSPNGSGGADLAGAPSSDASVTPSTAPSSNDSGGCSVRKGPQPGGGRGALGSTLLLLGFGVGVRSRARRRTRRMRQ